MAKMFLTRELALTKERAWRKATAHILLEQGILLHSV